MMPKLPSEALVTEENFTLSGGSAAEQPTQSADHELRASYSAQEFVSQRPSLQTVETAQPDETKNNLETWFLTKEVKGQGSPPDWFQKNKYKTLADQARAYYFLEKKLGHFCGAPEKYTLSYPENFPEDCKVSEEDPLFQYWEKIAKKFDMDNELFSSLYLGTVLNEQANVRAVRESEMSKLGPKAQDRIENLMRWAKNNLSQSDLETLQQNIQSAKMFELMEKIAHSYQEEQIPTETFEPARITQADLNLRVADPRYSTDDQFRRETAKMFEQLYGSQDEQTMQSD